MSFDTEALSLAFPAPRARWRSPRSAIHKAGSCSRCGAPHIGDRPEPELIAVAR